MNFTKTFDSDYLECGTIDLNWDIVKQDLNSIANEQTKNWSILNNTSYKDGLTEVQNEHLKYGWNEHNTRSWKTTNFDPPMKFDWEEQVCKQLPLDCAVTQIHRQDPGQTLPWHYDRFFMIKNLYPDDNRPIWRFLVFLEDWKTGHFLQVGDSVLHHWKQGDTVVWYPGKEHLATNVGLEKKWTCNVTGFLTV